LCSSAVEEGVGVRAAEEFGRLVEELAGGGRACRRWKSLQEVGELGRGAQVSNLAEYYVLLPFRSLRC